MCLQSPPVLLHGVSACPQQDCIPALPPGSWFQYLTAADSPLPEAARRRIEVVFVAARGDAALQLEAVGAASRAVLSGDD